jgi:hypothetical protein
MKLMLAVFVLCFVACATAIPTQTAGGGGACGELQPLNLDRGTEVFSAPDNNAKVLEVLPDSTSVCAASGSVGFGFHRVQLPNKSYGYVKNELLE